MTAPKYPHVKVKMTGEDGNAYAILGRVHQALKKAKVPRSQIAAFFHEAKSGDYDHLLQTVMKTVETE